MNPAENPSQQMILQLEQALDAIFQALEQILVSGEILSDEFSAEVAQEINEITQEIVRLQGENAPAAPAAASAPLPIAPYPSSNVNAFKYDPKTGDLFVKFHGTDSADSGPTYHYQGVPRNIYDIFSSGGVAPKTSGQNRYHRWIRGVTPSLGASLYALIRNGGYPYQKVG